ncbi:MAG TPA: GntR family transcriptional regulator [Candidatus Baltobacteraceae bacterium]|jgi:DNA-binding GntR family transcriptional regulator
MVSAGRPPLESRLTARAIARTSLHDEVVARLREMIEEGELDAGDRIPEREICERFKISRTPLREALKVLASEGLVEIHLNRGARVTQLTESAVREMFEVMGSLEALAGQLACERMSDAAIAVVENLNRKMAQYHDNHDLRSYFRLNREIHERIIRGTDNSLLLGLYMNLNARIRRARYAANRTQPRWDEAMHEHESIVSALVQRDGAGLSQILRTHLSHTCDAIVGMLRKMSGDEPVAESVLPAAISRARKRAARS